MRAHGLIRHAGSQHRVRRTWSRSVRLCAGRWRCGIGSLAAERGSVLHKYLGSMPTANAGILRRREGTHQCISSRPFPCPPRIRPSPFAVDILRTPPFRARRRLRARDATTRPLRSRGRRSFLEARLRMDRRPPPCGCDNATAGWCTLSFYGPFSRGLFSHGLYSFGLYSYGLYFHGWTVHESKH